MKKHIFILLVLVLFLFSCPEPIENNPVKPKPENKEPVKEKPVDIKGADLDSFLELYKGDYSGTCYMSMTGDDYKEYNENINFYIDERENSDPREIFFYGAVMPGAMPMYIYHGLKAPLYKITKLKDRYYFSGDLAINVKGFITADYPGMGEIVKNKEFLMNPKSSFSTDEDGLQWLRIYYPDVVDKDGNVTKHLYFVGKKKSLYIDRRCSLNFSVKDSETIGLSPDDLRLVKSYILDKTTVFLDEEISIDASKIELESYEFDFWNVGGEKNDKIVLQAQVKEELLDENDTLNIVLNLKEKTSGSESD